MALGLIVAGAAVAMRFLFEELSARAACSTLSRWRPSPSRLLLLAHLAMGGRVIPMPSRGTC
jgi:hypothetical protein